MKNIYESKSIYEARVIFRKLPEQIRKHYGEHFSKYSIEGDFLNGNDYRQWIYTLSENMRKNELRDFVACSKARGAPKECSTWAFWHVSFSKDEAMLQFSLVPGKLWIDCWEKTPDGDWVLPQSASIEG